MVETQHYCPLVEGVKDALTQEYRVREQTVIAEHALGRECVNAVRHFIDQDDFF